jgi:Phosphotransferase enzyme family
MNSPAIAHAAAQFGMGTDILVSTLSSGLIHQTHHVYSVANNRGIVLQQLNETVFKKPQQVMANYHVVHQHLQQTNGVVIPEPILSTTGEWLWKDIEGRHWRATAYMPDSYTETLPLTPEKARKAAASFAGLTTDLRSLPTNAVAEVLPDFHNLTLRFAQFQHALQTGVHERIASAHTVIEPLLNRKHYVNFYTHLIADTDFVVRLMHHDCKLSNVLFHKLTGDALCPIDLDTLMPGYYFSDWGDMVRSMAATTDETETDLATISIRSDVYNALMQGYLSEMEGELTTSEKKYFHHSGLLMIYMQALRFLTDYLVGDVYYKTTYALQNYDRALNQVTLLMRLEEFLQAEFGYRVNAPQ